MRPCFGVVVLVVCLLREALPQRRFEVEEVEEVLPVRLNGGGRVSKRSEEHPRFSLSAFGRTFYLSLNPDNSFISPNMKVYRIRAVDFPASGASEGQEAQRLRRQVADEVFTHHYTAVNTTRESGAELRGCFFTGMVDSSPDSVVALSLCHGMLGSFVLDGEEFQVEPKRFGSGSSTEQMHLIRRRNFTRTLLSFKTSFGPAEAEHYTAPFPVTEGKEVLIRDGPVKEATGSAEESQGGLRDAVRESMVVEEVIKGVEGTPIEREGLTEHIFREGTEGIFMESTEDSLDTVRDGTVREGTDSDATVREGTDSDGTVREGTDSDGTVRKSTDSDGTITEGTDSDSTVRVGTDSDGTVRKSTDSDGTITEGTDSDSTVTEGTDSDGKVRVGTDSNGTVTEGTDSDGTVIEGTDSDGTVREGTDSDGTVKVGTDSDGTVREGTDSNGTVREGTDSDGTVRVGTDRDGTGTDSDGTIREGRDRDGTGTDSDGTVKKGTDSVGTVRVGTDSDGTVRVGKKGQQDTVIGRKVSEGNSSRNRRFVSVPRFIETLVVADASMSRFYGDEIKHYILTLVSVAAQLYKHPSIKNSVNIVIVKLLIVEDEEVGPSLSSNGGLALRNFCSWQQLFNPSSQRHSEHFDTAVLFTREDICGHQSCDTLGVADVGTMCDPKRSCSVIEDSGLQAAFTLAHELGHVLSMPHDDSRNCERHFGPMAQNHIMAPVFNGFNKTSPWSPCSAFYITEFFDNGHGDCLLDAPEKTLPLPTDLPGLSYSLDFQCQQVFGEGFSYCHNSSISEMCSQLWCQQEGQSVCTTRNGSLPWADGTHCAQGRTCLDGVCTATEEVMKPKVSVDGGWGEWGTWQQCSRSCGGGVMFSYRECDQPAPKNGGSYCRGQRVQYQSCNTQACESSHGKSFREEQCEKHNNPNHFDIYGNIKQWIPKHAGVSPRDRCKLFCRARGSSEFRVFEAKVIDGTTCGPDTTSFCVQGQCIKAGCDLEIGSNKRLDKCGVCGGDGLSCRKISGSYNKVSQGYSDIVTIPIGATNIDIKQRSHGGVKHDGSYLAVKRANGEYILNGNFSVSTVEQDIPAHGAMLKYSGSATTLERIQSFRQLQEVLVIQLLSTAAEPNPPKVKYTFFIPKGVSFSKPKEKITSVHMIHPFGVPQWVLGDWSECSKSCGSGWSRRTVECKDNAGFYSNHCDKDLKPTDIRPCADLPCPMWQIGPWSSCSRTCGHGERRRSVLCIDYAGKAVEKEKCDSSKQPMAISEECIYEDCLELPNKQAMAK